MLCYVHFEANYFTRGRGILPSESTITKEVNIVEKEAIPTRDVVVLASPKLKEQSSRERRQVHSYIPCGSIIHCFITEKPAHYIIYFLCQFNEWSFELIPLNIICSFYETYYDRQQPSRHIKTHTIPQVYKQLRIPLLVTLSRFGTGCSSFFNH